MSADLDRGITLHPIRLGDRRQTAPGWLIVAQGAVRGILSSGPDGQVLHACACDRRILPAGGLMLFQDLDEAQAWLEERLPATASRAPSGRPQRASEEDVQPTVLSRADAEQAFLAAAMDYCWSIRDRSLPDQGPLRRLWTAFVELRRLSGAVARGTA
jgi:hypothetical protein